MSSSALAGVGRSEGSSLFCSVSVRASSAGALSCSGCLVAPFRSHPMSSSKAHAASERGIDAERKLSSVRSALVRLKEGAPPSA